MGAGEVSLRLPTRSGLGTTPANAGENAMKTHFRGLILRTVVLPLAAVVFAPAALADNWPQWRGPHLNGSSDAKNLPDKLEKDSAKWQAKLPGPSGGTPVVWENKIFVSALD